MEQMQLTPRHSRSPLRDAALRKQLVSRRQSLAAAPPAAHTRELEQLVEEIDAALERMTSGTFGLCETCHDPIEEDTLVRDPLCRNCIDHLSATERRALERDLDLAFQVQRGLLPPVTLAIDGWDMAYAYEPAGPVSGDYFDVIPLDKGAGLFMLGDVAGKGVAASMLMAQLHAIFRSFATVTRSVTDLVSKANCVFSQGNLDSRFATLAAGYFDSAGNVEMCNGGHCLPLHVSPAGVSGISSTGLPLGVLVNGEYPSRRVQLANCDWLVLYSDGVSEAFNPSREQYSVDRLAGLLGHHRARTAKELVGLIREDVERFRAGAPKSDDLTIMVLRRGYA
jgi:sigma-B regulation protein RsbU (phosphoserine phosphatase)